MINLTKLTPTEASDIDIKQRYYTLEGYHIEPINVASIVVTKSRNKDDVYEIEIRNVFWTTPFKTIRPDDVFDTFLYTSRYDANEALIKELQSRLSQRSHPFYSEYLEDLKKIQPESFV